MLTDTDSTKSTINSKTRAQNPIARTAVSTSTALVLGEVVFCSVEQETDVL